MVAPAPSAGADGEVRAGLPQPPAGERERLLPRAMAAPSSGLPVRQPPLVLRIWIAPWEDEAGDLHDQSFVYTMINPGRWMIEANRSQIAERFRPVMAPRPAAGAPAVAPHAAGAPPGRDVRPAAAETAQTGPGS
jgi:conjugal transfer pilus assembly protein TraV